MANETQNWPELAGNLYDKLTGKNAEITYQFDDLDVYVPSKTGESASHAHWKMNGKLRITTNDSKGQGSASA